MDSAVAHLDPAVNLAWFPLIARPRPPGLPLKSRIAELAELAATPANGTDHDRASRAAEVCNKAALIASDCAMPDLARGLCYRQHALFTQSGPLPDWAVKLSVQPILNIPRQLIREGDGEGAHTMLTTLYRAARSRSAVVIDDYPIELDKLTHTPDDHKTICTLIWTALLADGTRALALAGCWREAADSAAEHHGVGNRLLDGRQASILALLHEGRAEQAAAMIEQSTITEAWEHAVQSLLRVLCLPATEAVARHCATMLAVVGALVQERDASTAVFRVRAALMALNLAGTCDESWLRPLRTATTALAVQDAYAARDMLAHPRARVFLTAQQGRELDELVHACGLGVGSIAPELYGQMASAVERAEAVLRNALHQGCDCHR